MAPVTMDIPRKTRNIIPIVRPAVPERFKLQMDAEMLKNTNGTTSVNSRFMKMSPTGLTAAAADGQQTPHTAPNAIPASIATVSP